MNTVLLGDLLELAIALILGFLYARWVHRTYDGSTPLMMLMLNFNLLFEKNLMDFYDMLEDPNYFEAFNGMSKNKFSYYKFLELHPKYRPHMLDKVRRSYKKNMIVAFWPFFDQPYLLFNVLLIFIWPTLFVAFLVTHLAYGVRRYLNNGSAGRHYVKSYMLVHEVYGQDKIANDTAEA